ncbi:MAG TPA: hypothetical protein PK341_10675 [Spirochaetota bacterium]|nr:hypothetical protein [Spirochaetota bacterium]
MNSMPFWCFRRAVFRSSSSSLRRSSSFRAARPDFSSRSASCS